SVPPSARRTRLTSSSEYDVHVYRRLGPIRPLSVDALPPRAARRPSARPATAVSAAATGPRTAETAPRATCTGLRTMLPTASHARSRRVGGGAGVQAAGRRVPPAAGGRTPPPPRPRASPRRAGGGAGARGGGARWRGRRALSSMIEI